MENKVYIKAIISGKTPPSLGWIDDLVDPKYIVSQLTDDSCELILPVVDVGDEDVGDGDLMDYLNDNYFSLSRMISLLGFEFELHIKIGSFKDFFVMESRLIAILAILQCDVFIELEDGKEPQTSDS